MTNAILMIWIYFIAITYHFGVCVILVKMKYLIYVV